MPKKKVTKAEKVVKSKEEVTIAPTALVETVRVQPITQEFGNGDINVLRDKINEIIKSL